MMAVRYLFTDTAGIRRRGKVDRGIEGHSVALFAGPSDGRRRRPLARCRRRRDEQDTRDRRRGHTAGALVLLANKWDRREADRWPGRNLKRT